jgi:MoaA/NifB/PqqE/SkfB family radical SAM enzyme
MTGVLKPILRRLNWLQRGLTAKKIFNLFLCWSSFILKSKINYGMPVIVKLDINTTCNLKCTTCVHAIPGSSLELREQQFSASQKMTLDDYTRLINEVKPYAFSVSLYYLGDPIVNPELALYASIARTAGLNVHVSSNFSLPLSDKKIEEISKSGITHFTVCIDGYSQEVYQKSRVGGNIELVKANLAKLIHFNRLNKNDMEVEVQHISFPHNLHELDNVRDYCQTIGVDSFTLLQGCQANYTDFNFDKIELHGLKTENWVPRCLWPYFSLVIKYDGSVLPCCSFRTGEVYTANSPNALGNATSTSVRSVWNSQDYMVLRSAINSPRRHSEYLSKHKNFCAKCDRVCDTNLSSISSFYQDQAFESIYLNSPEGTVRRDNISL